MSPSPARRLLDWYDAHRRDLPWRRDADPYRVWVSEVMLQQTRVETVLPYYHRFLERFPDVAALAAADLEELLALWSGLGYYRRARQMHAAARQVVAEHGGRFPSTVEGLLSLPGIGPYTAAAVGSICFDRVEPVMDGNVERVVSRLLALEADPKSTAARRRLLPAAAELLEPGRPGDGNQALMELGATVCTPRNPKCLLCPLREPAPAARWSGGRPEADDGELADGGSSLAPSGGYPGCRARAQGNPEAFPPPRRRRTAKRERRLFALVERDGRILLFRRPDDSELLAGTWELPWVELAPEAVAATAAPRLAERYGGRWSVGEALGTFKHGITYRSIEVEVHRARVETEPAVAAAGPEGLEPAWQRRDEVDGLPLSSMVPKALGLPVRRR